MPNVKRFKYLKCSKYQKPYSSKANKKSKNKFFKKKTFNLFRKEKSFFLEKKKFSSNLTQSAFKTAAELINILTNGRCKKFSTLDQCIKILFDDNNDQINYKKSWFCKDCSREIVIETQHQRACNIRLS